MVDLSSLDVRALALELRALEDAYVDKCYQTREDEFVLKLRHPQTGPTHLLIRPGAWVARSRESPQTPENPSTLAMLLRKHLVGARLRRVDQHEFDRVIRLQMERGGEPFEVVVELFGKGNLIVTDPDRKILLSTRTERFAHRTVKRGETLVFPPTRVNPATLPRSEFEALAQRSEKDSVRFLALDLGLGGELSEELVHRAGLTKQAKANTIDQDGLDRLWAALRELLDRPPQPAVVTGTKGVGIHSVPLTAPVFRDLKREPSASVSEAILRASAQADNNVKPAADPELERLERQIGHQERGIQELGTEADSWEKRGHLLFAHYQAAALAIQKAKATIEAEDWAAVDERLKKKADAAPDAWVHHVAGTDAKRGRILLKLDGEEIPVDPFQSLEQNAATLYDESKRIRAKQENARIAVAEARVKLEQRRKQTQVAAAKPKAGPRAPAKRFWFEGHRWFYSSEGFLVVAGRDAASNEKLVKRHLGAGDRYVHADIHGAPSVIVKAEGRVPGEQTMNEACQFGATGSRAFAQFATADAFWVLPEQVSKTGETGEYVPRGSFIVRGTRHYLHKLKLELALGNVHLDAQGRIGDEKAPHPRLMAGPPSAVRHYAKRVAMIERGDLKPSDAAKQLAPLFGAHLDDVIGCLPPGTVRIVSRPEAPT